MAVCGQAHADACEPLIPRSLADALARAFPGYRTPFEYDNAPEDIRDDRSRGGTGCLGVGTADFTGDGKKDYVIGLTSFKGNAGLAVVALPEKGGWRFERLQGWGEHARSSGYVTVVRPGRYEATPSSARRLQPGARQSVDCPHWGARIGTVEASGTVYCYLNGRWLHVPVSD